jgi:N-alpha-acetyltransferase 30
VRLCNCQGWILFACGQGLARHYSDITMSTAAASTVETASADAAPGGHVAAVSAATIVPYESELQLPQLQKLIDRDLSEPYSVFTYRYFLNQWPHLSFLAIHPDTDECIGTVVCKLVRFSAPA